jgi:hypothetical protein
MRRVVLESPFAGNIWRRWLNRRYARRCLRDSCLRGEAPSPVTCSTHRRLMTAIRASARSGSNADWHGALLRTQPSCTSIGALATACGWALPDGTAGRPDVAPEVVAATRRAAQMVEAGCSDGAGVIRGVLVIGG